MKSFTLQLIDAKATYDLRHRILRPHQSIEACYYPADFEEHNFHLGAFAGNRLVSVSSYFRENHPEVEGNLQYRLRGMATDTDFRNQGAGFALLEKAEEILREKEVDTWWCNARVTAADYYLKFGMTQVGGIYEIKPIGMHKRMYKNLTY